VDLFVLAFCAALTVLALFSSSAIFVRPTVLTMHFLMRMVFAVVFMMVVVVFYLTFMMPCNNSNRQA
jgi:hypothetical protein